jgi:hypothetical protein
VYRFCEHGYHRIVTALSARRSLPPRPIALGLLGLGGVVILAAAWLDFSGLPVPSGTTPYSALGPGWLLRDLALFAGIWSFFGFVFGGWKVMLVAIGRAPGGTTGTLVWLTLFAAYLVWLAAWTIHRFGFHVWY